MHTKIQKLRPQTSTMPWPTPSPFPHGRAARFDPSPRIAPSRLVTVRQPWAWSLRPGSRATTSDVAEQLAWAERGLSLDEWTPPMWLLAHQVSAAQRIAGALSVFPGAILADAVGLGKTFVALAVSTL